MTSAQVEYQRRGKKIYLHVFVVVFLHYYSVLCFQHDHRGIKIKQLFLLFLSPFLLDAIKKTFTQLAHNSFTGFPNLLKTTKVGV